MKFVSPVGLASCVVRTRIHPRCRIRTGSSNKAISFSSSSAAPNDAIERATLLLLQQVKDGTLTIDKAVMQLSQINNIISTASPLASFANIDHDRYSRTNFPEVIFAQGKTSLQVATILEEMAEKQIIKQHQTTESAPTSQQKRCVPPILATRVVPEMYKEIDETYKFCNGTIEYNPLARIVSMRANIPSTTTTTNTKDDDRWDRSGEKRVVVATAGTTDIMVAEEAAVTLEASDVPVDRIYDVGVAGLHRIINALPKLTHPNVGCIIVCAGMDGALPSVVGGLVQVPVVAVPTSIGYGAAFQGVSALLTMLNSCAPGVGVVNIDNGFGAAALAYKCIQ